MPNQESQLDRVFRALADPTRRAVVQRLCDGPASVSELARPFDMALPSFVQHLRVLEDSGLVRSRKLGRVRTCEMASDAVSGAEDWISTLRRNREARFRRLDALLEKHDEEG
jgi:DNA-binding transcriptional ArsR family regulator